jgi:hypothetical protein
VPWKALKSRVLTQKNHESGLDGATLAALLINQIDSAIIIPLSSAIISLIYDRGKELSVTIAGGLGSGTRLQDPQASSWSSEHLAWMCQSVHLKSQSVAFRHSPSPNRGGETFIFPSLFFWNQQNKWSQEPCCLTEAQYLWSVVESSFDAGYRQSSIGLA